MILLEIIERALHGYQLLLGSGEYCDDVCIPYACACIYIYIYIHQLTVYECLYNSLKALQLGIRTS